MNTAISASAGPIPLINPTVNHGINNGDTKLIVDLLGTENVINLCNLFQRFPGYGLEMLSDIDLKNVVERLGIDAGRGTTASGSPPRGQLISQFQSKAQKTLTSLLARLRKENDSGLTNSGDGFSQSKGKVASPKCVRCEKEEPKEKLVECALRCGSSFHEDSCAGKQFPELGSTGRKFVTCSSCTGIILLSQLVPDILTENNKKTLNELRPYILNTDLVAQAGANNGIGTLSSLPMENLKPQELLQKGMINSKLPGQDFYFNQLNQIQLLGQQLSGAFPPLVSPNLSTPVPIRQQYESTQSVFQLWGSLGVNQQSMQVNTKSGSPETKVEPQRQPSSNPQSKKRRKQGDSRATKIQKTGENSVDGETEERNKGKQRRTRWLHTELETLWRGILHHGNRWYEVKNNLPGRTYYQVKDKGRRLLYTHGWKTGRLKNDNNGAYEDAKAIARVMLSGNLKRPGVSSA